MSILFFLLWLVLNGHFGWDIAFLEIVLFGLAVSAAVSFFMMKYTKWTWKTELFFLRNLPLFLAYAAVLLYEVMVSALHVTEVIVNPEARPDPAIVLFEAPLSTPLLVGILANSITLTPGTITVSAEGNRLLVHCLKKEYMDGFDKSALVRILKKAEESAHGLE